MIRTLQHHVRLAHPSSLRLTRRLVYHDCKSAQQTSPFMPIRTRAQALPSRTFSSSRPYATTLYSEHTPSTSPPPPSSSTSQSTTVLMSMPSKEALDQDEELIEGAEARFQISPRAALQLQSIATRENDPTVALRVAVESGGCHGYQYKIELTSLTEGAGDYHFSLPTIAPSNVLIDPVSLSLLKGSTLDFATELIGSSFRVTDNPQAAGGCGCGVSWEAKFD